MFALMLAVTLAAPAAAPPDGTYNYVQIEGGKRVAHYTVSVKRSGTRIDVKGELEPDVAGLQRPIVESNSGRRCVDAGPAFVPRNGRDRLRRDAVRRDRQRLAGAARPKDLRVPRDRALYLRRRPLGAALLAGRSRGLERRPRGFACAGSRRRSRRRAVSDGEYAVATAGRPASDRYLALHELGAKSGSSGLWYNPDTMVVDEVDTATAQWLRKDHL